MTKEAPMPEPEVSRRSPRRLGHWPLGFGHSLVIGHWSLVIGLLLLLLLSSGQSSRGDEFDSLRGRWRDMLTFGTNSTKSDPTYSNWIATVVEAQAQKYWKSMNTNASRTNLWSDLNTLATDSSDITGSYGRLRAMAMGYAVHGSSNENNTTLRGAITNGLDWLYTNYYNEGKSQYTNVNNNWFDWEIATPLNLNDVAVLMYTNLTAAQVSHYMLAIDHFTPNSDTVNNGSTVATGANKVWKASILGVSGAVGKSSAKLSLAKLALSDVFPYVTNGDGFYTDGSFVFHSNSNKLGGFAYNGGYGAQLLDTIGPLMQLLTNSTWQVTDPAQTNLFRWVYDSFAPFIYRGASLQMVSGRYYTRGDGDDHVDGHDVLGAILRLAQIAPPADAAAYKALVKSWIQSDTYADFIQTQFPPFNLWAQTVMNDPTIVPASEPVRHYQFPHSDRAVHLRSGWGFGLAMSSSRIGNYESINGENLQGWYTGDGMTCLYNADLAHFADDFWSTINPYRLPGTTVDTQSRAPASDQGYQSSNPWVGGASLQNLYGVVGMQLNASSSTLTARKSWFMFDDEIVCLGAGITSSDGRTIETIVENRRLAVYGNNPFTVNGLLKPSSVGWSETMLNPTWAHLAGNVPGSDIGYYFPQAGALKGLREARGGSFTNLNIPYGSTNQQTRNYLTLWFDHGVNPSSTNYAYVLLPGQSAGQVAAYAASPDVTVLGNSSTAQGVKESTLGLTAVNFWKDGTNRLGGITVDRKSSIIMRNDGTFLELGISDPTQTNTGLVSVEITNITASAALSWDPAITIVQTTPTVKLAVNVNGAGGQTFHARFFVGPVQTLTLSPVADAYIENGTNANANFGGATTLIVKTNSSNTNLTREAYLRFALPPAPGLIFNATLRLLPTSLPANTLEHALALVTDNSWTESGITWNNRPASGSEFTRWVVPTVAAPVQVPLTSLAQQAAAGDGSLSLRIYQPGTNTAFTAYGSKENGTVLNRPQLILNLGRVPPSVVLTNPADGTVLDAPAALMLAASAQDSDGWVTNVDFYSSSTKIAQFANGPYALALSNLGPGQYSFTAVAADVTGLISTSAPVTVTVCSSQPSGTGTGLLGYYYTNLNFIGLMLTRTDLTVNFNWGSTSPAPVIPADRFSARWVGKLQTKHAGTHLFHVVSDEGARLWVNGQLVVDDWNPHAATEDTGAIPLLAGEYYDLRMEYFDLTNTAVAQLYWTQPGAAKEIIPQTQLYPAASGLLGSYSFGTNLTNYVFSRVDPAVNFAWGNSSPDPTLLPGGFAVRWSGKVRAKPNLGGTYTFYTVSEGGVSLLVGNQTLITNWTEHALTTNIATATLSAGQSYRLTLDYYNRVRTASAVLMWAPPGEPQQVIPEMYLTPLQNNSPPMLAPIPDTTVAQGRSLAFTATAADLDQPFQSLAFSLDAGAPAGAGINPMTGLFTWTPSPTQALGDYNVTVRATDNGLPVMTDAQTVTVTVTTNLTAASVTVVPTGAVWRYLDTGVDQGVAWRGNNFNDASWKSGSAQLGYGTGHESTTVSYGPNANNKYPTTYFRRAFFIPDASLVESLSARLLRNDGAVVYLNGAEVWRDNMPAGAVSYATLAATPVDGSVDTNLITCALNSQSLLSGTNIVAVEIHQASAAGPDIAFDLELTGVAAVPTQAGLSIAPTGGAPLLKWPVEAGLLQLYTSTNLINWFPATNTPSLYNSQWILSIPITTNHSQFYRLQSR